LSLEVMLVVLAGAALHAAWNALVKSGSDPLLDTVLISAGVAAASAVMLIFVPSPHPSSWPFLAASAAVHLLYFGFMTLAYRGSELSVIYPIMRGSSPAFTVIAAALLLHEQTTWNGWVGVFLVSGGIWLLAANSPRSKNVRLAPVCFALLNAGVIMGYSLIDGVGVRRSGNAFSYTAWVLMIGGSVFSLMMTVFDRKRMLEYVLQRWKKGVFGGGCTLASYSLALWAMTKAPIGPVAALRETSIVFSALLAVVILKENISPLRWISIIVVTAGAIAIKGL
jgi:drug/metabolite transporter (DMT)-like permease